MSISAYQTTSRIKEDPRETEYRIFVRVTAALEKHVGAKSLTSEVATAIHDNRRLWNALADDLNGDANTFSDELKASLISLALWVNRESSAITAGNGSIQALIEVNRMILRGLSATVANDRPQPEGSASHGAHVEA